MVSLYGLEGLGFWVRVHVPNFWVCRVVFLINSSTGFGAVFDYWVLGPFGSPNNSE